MPVFVLHVPADKMTWAQSEASKAGGQLHADSLSGSVVLMAATLPESLALFVPGAAPASQAVVRKDPEPIRTFVLDVPFAMRAVAQSLGARWEKESKSFIYEGSRLPVELAPFSALAWSWEDAVQKAKAGLQPRGWKGEDPYELRVHQTVAGQAIVSALGANLPGFLLADDVGLGKTLSAWLGVQLVAKKLSAQRVVIVCPLSVQAHWRETLRRQGSDVGEVLIINYERLGKLFELDEGVKVKSKKGLARRGSAAETDIIIFDESHKLKNPLAARSKLGAKLVSNSKFVLWLSATAGQTPLELSYLAPLLAKGTGARARDLTDFEGWCQLQGFKLKKGAYGAWSWDGDLDDCHRLAALLFEGKTPLALRRRPQEIAGWPEISRSLWPQELNPEERALYQQEWMEFRSALVAMQENAMVNIAAKSGTRAMENKGKQVVVNKSIGGLLAALRFRQKSSLLRVDATVDFSLDLLEQGIKPAISCAFIETMHAIAAKLTAKKKVCAKIYGGQSASEREAERLRFQRGQAEVVLFTIEEGISLHQGEYEDVPRSLLIHDLRWSAIQMAQIEGRTHRNGQFAQAYWLLGEGTIEAKIASRVARRAVAMKALSGETDASLEKEIIDMLLVQS